MRFKFWLNLSETIIVKDQEFRDPLYALERIQKTHPNPENLVVTFTAIDKVGINPKSKYNTPLGIYFYPLSYVLENEMKVPFAGDQPYINVCEFTQPEKILHMTSDVNDQKGLELLNAFSKEKVDVAVKEIEDERRYQIRSNYSKLWLITREIAENKSVQWNAALRKCEIGGFVDHGTGTIHRAEPTQGVVFAANALRRILVIPKPRLFDMLKLNNRMDISNLVKYRTLSGENVMDLLTYASDKDEVARNLGPENMNKLSGGDVENLLNYANNKDERAKFIIQYKTELSGGDVTYLLHYATNKDEIARILGPNNINKLSDNHVAHLLHNATDKDEMARILGSNNINKLSAESVGYLLRFANYKEDMARILGPENINKLSAESVDSLNGA